MATRKKIDEDINVSEVTEELKKELIEELKKEIKEDNNSNDKEQEANITSVEEIEDEDDFYADYRNYKEMREEYNNKYKSRKEKGPSSFKLGFIMVFSFIIGAMVMIGLIKYTPLLQEVIGSTDNTVITKNKTQVYEKASLAPSVEKIYDAVVVIQCYKNDQLASTGTGFVYKTDNKYGYILTNAHVVSEMEKVNVTFTDDEEAEVKVLGSDSYLDLAVLRVDKKYVSLVANIGSSEDVKIGDSVFTVGSPMGYDYRGSVTSGILSGKDRMVAVSVSNSQMNDWVMRVLQIDASINPGNSGGPLLNINGEVIGVCSMKLVDDEIEGMGFAIPIEYAMSHVEQLEKGEDIEWPVLGVSMANINDTGTLYRNNIRVDDSIKAGVVVISTTDNSAAKEAGLKAGDVITKLGGNSTKNIAYLRYELYQHSAGDEIEIEYIRDGKTQTVKVKLGKSS